LSMQEEDLKEHFTDFEGRFNARLSSVIPVRRAEVPSEATGISAKYECRIKAEYQKDLMGLLEEGMLLAVRNFKSKSEGERRFTLLEISRIGPEHYGLKGLTDHAYYPYQFEIIEQTVQDWATDDKATMMIQIAAIPLNYDLAVDENGDLEYVKGFTYPVIAERVHILNRDTIHQMYNRTILERMGRPWHKILTSEKAREDPRIGTVKMFEVEEERIPIYVDFERLVRYHFGIFGFTGCGKSNLLSNVLRKIIYHTRDTKVVIFDISMEYPFLLQDLVADEKIPSKIVLETAVEDADQLYRIVVKPKVFEKDERAKSTFQKMLDLDKVGYYVKPTVTVPTYQHVLDEVESFRPDSADKPNYLNAIDEIHRAIAAYVKKRGVEQTQPISREFVDYLNASASEAVDKFRVSEKSNLYAWAKTRSALREILESKELPEEVGAKAYTLKKIMALLEGDTRLLCLSVADPNVIKGLAIDLSGYVLARRKKEFKVDPSILFVFDEAQEFIPAYDKARGIEKECTERVETFLRQGRKYGLGGCIATQRIAYLNTNALQQLHTYFVGPLPRPYDRNLVSSTFTIDQGILEKTLEFAPGEWLLSSYIATGMENVPIFIKADNAEQEIESTLSGA